MSDHIRHSSSHNRSRRGSHSHRSISSSSSDRHHKSHATHQKISRSSSNIGGHHYATYAEGYGGGIWAKSFWRPMRKIRWKLREFLAEMIGTACITCIGPAVGCLTTYTGTGTGDWMAVTIGWALAVMMGVFMSPASGGHLNPAVTLCMAVYEGFPLKKVPVYIAAQFIGGYLGALVTLAIYWPVIKAFGGGEFNVNPTGIDTLGPDNSGAFVTWPHPDVGFGQAFGIEIGLTAILLMGILAMTSPRGAGAGAGGLTPVLVMLLILSIGTSFGAITGYALNPARDMGPRLALCTVGYDCGAVMGNNSYFLVPLFAPLIGGVVGGAIFFMTNDTKRARR